MKRVTFVQLVVLLVVSGVASLARTEEPAKQRVVLITFDAFRPEVVEDARFAMPNLRALAARGILAKKVTGIFPTLTYPSHTTLVTGVRSARHGIVSNFVFGGDWHFHAAHIRATTLWDAARTAGRTSAAVHWPVTVGAKIDWNVPEIFGKDHDPTPHVRAHTTPEGLFQEVWPHGQDVTTEPGDDEASVKVACALLEKKKPDLLLLHLLQSDGAQHESGRDDQETITAFQKLDEHLGRILATLEKSGLAASTNVIVTGDHGMMDVHTALKPNVLLHELGFISSRDWVARAHQGGGSAAIYLRDPSDRYAGERVLAALKGAAQGRYRGIFQLVDRETLDREEAFPGAVCAIEAEAGFTFRWDEDGELLVASKVRGDHGHLPSRPELATCLVAAGPGLARGRTIAAFRQVDVAPLVAHLLRIELPGTEGVLVPGILARD